MAFDAFLKIDGIPGESTDSKHKDEIEVLSWSWGLAQSGSAASGGGGGAGKVTFQDFHFVNRLQKSSPKLFLACASGQHFKSAILTVRKAGGEGQQQDYYKVTLDEIIVSSFNQTGEPDGDQSVPLEQVSINFSKITVEYKPQNEKGSLGDSVVAKWDVGKNKPF